MASVLFMIFLLKTADKMKRSNYRGINHMNESAKRLWEKKLQSLELKHFNLLHMKQLKVIFINWLYILFSPPLSQENSPPYLLVMSTFLCEDS